MNFAQAVKRQANKTTTANGSKAFVSTNNAVLDFFYKAGASRGRDMIAQFNDALSEDVNLAMRALLWLRDARGGAGERQIYRDILLNLEATKYFLLTDFFIEKMVELGRWDDLLIFKSAYNKRLAYSAIKKALYEGNGLASKWMPRKGPIAVELTKFLGVSPRMYRKMLVAGSNTVEQLMSARKWSEIEYSKLPSIAYSRYQKAFEAHDYMRYSEFLDKANKGEAKVNASAIYPYQVMANLRKGNKDAANAQWNALPDYMNDARVLPMVDTSGSMTVKVGSSTALDIALSLGMYAAERNKNEFKNLFLTFSSKPRFQKLSGDTLFDRFNSINTFGWEMSTNFDAAFEEILKVATKYSVPQSEMPEYLLVLSDMQFNAACHSTDTTFQRLRKKYAESGYKLPVVIFWNLQSYDNVPTTQRADNVIMVSGFSPAVMKSILEGKPEVVNPVEVMKEILLQDRYNWEKGR